MVCTDPNDYAIQSLRLLKLEDHYEIRFQSRKGVAVFTVVLNQLVSMCSFAFSCHHSSGRKYWLAQVPSMPSTRTTQ